MYLFSEQLYGTFAKMQNLIDTMLYTITKNGVWLDNSDTVIQTRQLIWWCFKAPALISQNPL